MATHKAGCFIHVPKAYDEPQETAQDIIRAMRMWEVLSRWDSDQRTIEAAEKYARENRPNKADVTHTP